VERRSFFLKRCHMKPPSLIPLFLAGALVLSSQAKADVVFGNSLTGEAAFQFAADGGIAGGGAVEFTPLEDVTFGSITVWLSGYTGLDMYGRKNQSFYAGVWIDGHYPGSGNSQPVQQIASLQAPSPNDGTAAAFTFINSSGSTVLSANTSYWLFIYESTSGSFNAGSVPQWLTGGPVSGKAVCNGSASFWNHSFTPSSTIPAFAFNSVPEPGPCALLALSLLLGWASTTCQRGRGCRNCPLGSVRDVPELHRRQGRQH
jgi:hypothetical protein